MKILKNVLLAIGAVIAVVFLLRVAFSLIGAVFSLLGAVISVAVWAAIIFIIVAAIRYIYLQITKR